jgi:surface carbohydrate biosynthesis protein (TIGR04326 family)
VYIKENQPWEMALIYAWKINGHGKLIGVPHTTVRFWDLRYFFDPRTYVSKLSNKLPMPDIVAVNGPVAKKSYINNGYQKHLLREAEALRYFHLTERIKNPKSLNIKINEITVLICGDFLKSTTHIMLNMLSNVCSELNSEQKLIFKPHPGQSVNIEEYSHLNINISNDSLIDLFERCDVVLVSNITSVAVDAYYQQIPLIQINDRKGFNMSPLRSMENIFPVNNHIELKDALMNIDKYRHGRNYKVDEYFFLDKKLPRWGKILDLKFLNETS